MSKNIGILTFWGVPNYGAFAQAYAFNSLLGTIQEEYRVSHIGYLHQEHQKLYAQNKLPKLNGRLDLINPRYYWRWIKYFKNKKVEYPSFAKDWNMIPHETVKTDKELEKRKWDIIFTGSDAIWEYSIKEFGDDIHLIGNNLNCDKLYAYAASFGEMNINSDFPDFVKQGLTKYQRISVRDAVSCEIVKELTGIIPEIVLDPTLLWNFQDDSNIPIPSYENYILVYGNHFSDEMIAEVKEYAKEKQLRIIGAGLAPEWCDYRLNDIGPLEWIGMFSRAEFVVTCTFHGLMFSINYSKKVLFNQIGYTINRSAKLLSDLGLAGLFQGKITLKEVLDYPWDYNAINHKLNILREKSQNFLLGAIHNE